MCGSSFDFMLYLEDGKCPACGATLNRIIIHARVGTHYTPYIEIWHVDTTQAPCLYRLDPNEHGMVVLAENKVTYHH